MHVYPTSMPTPAEFPAQVPGVDRIQILELEQVAHRGFQNQYPIDDEPQVEKRRSFPDAKKRTLTQQDPRDGMWTKKHPCG